ncbi:YkgJ family cysteine cluster protein [Geopseudomonas guangdongensis]|uniref:YkgJ family cysteine cluster protein n=1 Tax=Geopseudomonas guangdongensis TaxID=1245526 RepID=UPI000B7F6EB8
MIPSAFPCTQCGLCCRNVRLAEQTRYLDRGDGACRNYSDADKKCLIYETRPDICRVGLQYKTHYSQQYSWEAFIEANTEVCRALQIQEFTEPN